LPDENEPASKPGFNVKVTPFTHSRQESADQGPPGFPSARFAANVICSLLQDRSSVVVDSGGKARFIRNPFTIG